MGGWAGGLAGKTVQQYRYSSAVSGCMWSAWESCQCCCRPAPAISALLLTVLPCLYFPACTAAGDALYAMELSLSLEKLNFDKLLQLWQVSAALH